MSVAHTQLVVVELKQESPVSPQMLTSAAQLAHNGRIQGMGVGSQQPRGRLTHYRPHGILGALCFFPGFYCGNISTDRNILIGPATGIHKRRNC